MFMKLFCQLALLGFVSASYGNGVDSLFGVVPRGGGLFGGNTKAEEDTAVKETERQQYPAMTQDEIEEWLAHIPVYAVTDSNGAGVVLKPDSDTNVFYFFMNPVMANQTLTTLKSSNEDLDLRVSAFSLGKIWFRVLKNGDNTEVKLKQPGDDDSNAEVSNGVEYRLVPDTRDLLGARMLLTMDPKDNESMQNGEVTEDIARKAIEKAMTEATKFNATYNEIPVFMIQQMRMQKQPEEGSKDEEAVTLLPMYFNLQNMVAIWQQFASQSTDVTGIEPNINLLDLFELVEKMQEESEIDFRNVVLVPSAPGVGAAPEASSAASPTGDVQMPGATLGDL